MMFLFRLALAQPFFRANVVWKAHKIHSLFLCMALGDDCSYPFIITLDKILNSNGLSVLSFDWDGHGIDGSSVLDFQQNVVSTFN